MAQLLPKPPPPEEPDDRFPELSALEEATASLASGADPLEILTSILSQFTIVAGGRRTVMLVTGDELAVLAPGPRLPETCLELSEQVGLVCAGSAADEIRDWEGASKPFITNDGERFFLPLPNRGLAVEQPSCAVIHHPTQLRVLRILANVAAGVIRLAAVAAAAEGRVAALERTRHRLRDQTIMLRELAVLDALTGLHNRRFFERRLSYELDRLQRGGDSLSIILVDVDRFKRVNDVYGHAGGDEVLRQLADLGRASLRRGDLLCRYGGEELAVLLPETGAAGALVAAERLRAHVAKLPLRFAEHEIAVTVSAGVATANGGWEGTGTSLVEAADEALYRAKSAGRDRVEVAATGT